jgi:hypothetical protein
MSNPENIFIKIIKIIGMVIGCIITGAVMYLAAKSGGH